MTVFGQLVIGPPGAGKTTYCDGMQQMMHQLKRDMVVVNLDPGNDAVPYEVAIDIRELISVEDVMEEYNLGPNGSLIYCMEYIVENLDWLKKEFDSKCKGKYVIFDMPGQVELYTHHESLRELCEALRNWDCRLCAVHLVDSVLCTDPHKFVSSVWISLAAMMQLELPHVNVLSKVDILKTHHQDLDFRLEHYLDVSNLKHLSQAMYKDNHPLNKQFVKFNEEMCEVMEDYGLVGFVPLDIQDKEATMQVLVKCDQSNGRLFGASGEMDLFDVALGCSHQPTEEYVGRLQEEFCEEQDPEFAQDSNKENNDDQQKNPSEVRDCQWCEAPGAKQQCSRCKQVSYCSRECQRFDWARHKYNCTPF